ncbi:MAG: lipopolysaccharide biosynthesis protein [Rhodothermales bacterium]
MARTLTNRGFRGPVLTLLSGSGLALALGYAADLVLTRFYTPTDYELFAVFTYLFLPLNAIGALRYEDALMLPDSDDGAKPLLGLSVYLISVLTLIIGLAVWGFADHLEAYYNLPGLEVWLWLLPVVFLLERLRKLCELWLTRRSRFRLTSTAHVTQTLTNKSIAVGLGVPSIKAGPFGLFIGFTLARVAALTVLTRSLRPWPIHWPSWQQARRLLRRYQRFPLFSCPSALINTGLVALPGLLLGGLFEGEFIAHYQRVFLTIAVPLGIIGGAVGQVFFVRAAESNREGALAPLTQTIHGRLVALGLFPTLAVVIAGPDLFAFVFSEPWRPAGEFARVLAPWLFLASVASPLTRLFDVLERQRLDLASSVVMLVVIGSGLSAVYFTDDTMMVLLALGMTGLLARVLHLGVMFAIAGVGFLRGIQPYLIYGLCALPGLGLIAWAATSSAPIWTFTAALFGLVCYGVLALYHERRQT